MFYPSDTKFVFHRILGMEREQESFDLYSDVSCESSFVVTAWYANSRAHVLGN